MCKLSDTLSYIDTKLRHYQCFFIYLKKFLLETSEYILKRTGSGNQADICTLIIIAVLVTIPERRKQPRCPLMGK